MSTDGNDYEELVVVSPNTTNNNNNNNQELIVEEGLLFYMLYWATLEYATIIPRFLRRVIEFVFLLQPAGCFDLVKDIWPRDGVLRVEIINSFKRSVDISEKNSLLFSRFTKTYSPDSTTKTNSIRGVLGIDSILQSTRTNLSLIDDHKVKLNENYIVEYSLYEEYLILSPSDRSQYGIPVMLVALDLTNNKCYGDSVSQFYLKYFLDYDHFMLWFVNSISENKGFIRNVISGEHYNLGNISMDRMKYISSFLIMAFDLTQKCFAIAIFLGYCIGWC
ncbi:membralin-like [Acyrthosiphon pisum]|uniref:Uncharacterized protein n=1 Tax=Acyrthosiphon pisum TaxID=7029 RepID=A0A8R2B6V5_ACYPI|nr:membralin-like [Acyrthosiphon pisum]|eukprot:XP_008184141.1 PREDICTED: membralin-like [Acyrthosiphon pisum]